jgi:uncharacterized membrane protein
MHARLRTAAWIAMTALSAGVALVSYRYLAPEPPAAAPNVVANAFANPFLAWHAGTAATALLLGAFQFVRGRGGRRPRWHRAAGAVYVAACLTSAPGALILALGTTAGPIGTAGFGLLALAWFYTTAQGVRAVLGRRYTEHGRWMLRSYALTFAAVTLRLYLPLPPALGFDFMEGYRAIAFLCWVPNLLAVEAWLAWKDRPSVRRLAV